jgi:hypothetical protein
MNDTRVQELWLQAAFDPYFGPAPNDFAARAPASAQLVLRNAQGRIEESLDLALPLATLQTRRLGDDPVPFIEVVLDTYRGTSRWGGTTTRFVRVEGGHAHWLPCEVYSCTFGCTYPLCQ